MDEQILPPSTEVPLHDSVTQNTPQPTPVGVIDNSVTPPPPKIIPKWAIALVIIVVLVLFGSGMFILMKKYQKPNVRYPSQTSQVSPTITTQTTPTTLPIELTTYKNDKYQFTLQYPSKGKDMNGKEVTCGAHIVSSPADNVNGIIDQYVVDSFFTITVIQTNVSLNDYIQSLQKNVQENSPTIQFDELYDFTPIQNSGADEAVIVTPKANADRGITDADNVGFGSTGALYKKVNTLYVLGGIQDYAGPDMCVPPAGSKSWRPSEFSGWDVPLSIHFD